MSRITPRRNRISLPVGSVETSTKADIVAPQQTILQSFMVGTKPLGECTMGDLRAEAKRCQDASLRREKSMLKLTKKMEKRQSPTVK